jgi:subtilisin family serine protease
MTTMSCTRHKVRSSDRFRSRYRFCEPLELRLLLAIDVLDDVLAREHDPAPAKSSAPEAAQVSAISPAAAIAFPDVPDFGGPDQWNLNAVGAPESWARGFTGQGVVVAIVDSGIDAAHPALLGQIWSNADEIMGDDVDDGNGFLDDAWGWDFADDEPLPADESGHGTHLAGIIAGDDNGTGITGIAPGATIMPVRVLGPRNSGYLVNVAAGIRYAADNGADIINISIGSPKHDGVAEAIEYALNRDVLVVAAAGNDDAEAPTYPAALSATLANTISVGGYRAAGSLGGSSNLVGTSGAVQVDAPGINILSSFAGGGTMYMGGTSMATAHVAGIAALALSANPNLTAAELRNLIVAGADRKVEGSDALGAVNAARTVAIAEAMRLVSASPQRPIDAIPEPFTLEAPLVEPLVLSELQRPATPAEIAPIASNSPNDKELVPKQVNEIVSPPQANDFPPPTAFRPRADWLDRESSSPASQQIASIVQVRSPALLLVRRKDLD